MFKTMNYKYKILISMTLILIILYCYARIQYSERFNIIIKNNTDEVIEHIIFKTNMNSVFQIKITDIAPYETMKISRHFNKVSDSFVAVIDTSEQSNQVIPLAYVYSPNTINIAIITIEGVKDKKITKITVKSFDNYFSIIPWWIRTLYDYSTSTYDVSMGSN